MFHCTKHTTRLNISVINSHELKSDLVCELLEVG